MPLTELWGWNTQFEMVAPCTWMEIETLDHSAACSRRLSPCGVSARRAGRRADGTGTVLAQLLPALPLPCASMPAHQVLPSQAPCPQDSPAPNYARFSTTNLSRPQAAGQPPAPAAGHPREAVLRAPLTSMYRNSTCANRAYAPRRAAASSSAFSRCRASSGRRSTSMTWAGLVGAAAPASNPRHAPSRSRQLRMRSGAIVLRPCLRRRRSPAQAGTLTACTLEPEPSPRT